MTPPLPSVFLSWRMSLKRVSNRDSFQSSSTERSVSVKVGTHLTLRIMISRRRPVESYTQTHGQVADAHGRMLLAVGDDILSSQGRRLQRSLW